MFAIIAFQIKTSGGFTTHSHKRQLIKTLVENRCLIYSLEQLKAVLSTYSSALFIKKFYFYYKASHVNYVALKLRFAQPLPPNVTLFLDIQNVK
jgi:hypothetical protein